MTFKIEYSIETEEDTHSQVLRIEAHTDYPITPLLIKLDDGSSFGVQTDIEGIARCSTSEIKNYHVTVKIHDETFEDDINIEN